MADQPLLTIVTPVFNGSNYIEQQIQSIQRQTYPNIEHIIIDDGSTDDGKTVQILEKYKHLKWWTRPNIGQAETVNEGFRAAKGDWVTTLSHDDYYHSSRSVESLIRHAQRHPSADVVYGLTRFVNQDGKYHPAQQNQKYPHWFIQYHCFTFHCALFVRTEKLRRHELYFDSSLYYNSDDDWLKRMHLMGLEFSRYNCAIANYRIHPSQMTSEADVARDKSERREQDCERVRQMYGPDEAKREFVRKIVRRDKKVQRFKAALRGYYTKNGQWHSIWEKP